MTIKFGNVIAVVSRFRHSKEDGLLQFEESPKATACRGNLSRHRCGFHILFSSVQSVTLAICKFYEELHNFLFQISRGSSIPGRMTNAGLNCHFRTQHEDVYNLAEKSPTLTCPEVVKQEG